MIRLELLANKIRPKALNEVIGQTHLVGEGKILSNLVKNKKIFSFILYGKPGIGKTSIANAIVSELGVMHRFLNATINNKKDFDNDKKTINACVFLLGQIGELVSKVSEELINNNPQVEWRGLKALRNRIVHDYEGVNLIMVWDFLTTELEDLEKQINDIINK